jgi:hypothetical protein
MIISNGEFISSVMSMSSGGLMFSVTIVFTIGSVKIVPCGGFI